MRCWPFSNPFRRRGIDALYMELVAINLSITHTRREIMTKLDDVNAKIDELTAALTTEEGKTDTLITLVTDLKAQLAQASGTGGASPDQLDALIARLDGVLTQVNAEGAKEDAALAPAAPPAAP